MNVEEFVEAIEASYLEDALNALKKNPKDLVLIYLNAKEFLQPKLMRGNTIVENETTDKEIIIKVVDNTSNTDIQ